jgi:hypothetical protein
MKQLQPSEFYAVRAPNTSALGPDWLVESVTDRGPQEYYRYHVSGLNLNHPPGVPDHHYSWSVRDLDGRFELCSAVSVMAHDGTHWHIVPKEGQAWRVETLRD